MKCEKDTEEESIEIKRRMTLVSSDVLFPSDADKGEQHLLAVDEQIVAPKGILHTLVIRKLNGLPIEQFIFLSFS